MAGLVDYSDSESEEDVTPRKKRKVVSTDEELPPLPAGFLDQYSSTVRTSTQDDPSLHAGRKRVTPHVEGNWPAHVYLEWHPPRAVAEQINEFLPTLTTRPEENSKIHSLLQNDLGVPLPLHISLSRPLILKTEQKDSFLRHLTQAVANEGISSFHVTPKDLAWHPNESSTRWFLVLRLDATETPELAGLLTTCNDTALKYKQPRLYVQAEGEDPIERFHISLAWCGSSPSGNATTKSAGKDGISYAAMLDVINRSNGSAIEFAEVKVRIGQDVNIIPLKTRRKLSLAAK